MYFAASEARMHAEARWNRYVDAAFDRDALWTHLRMASVNDAASLKTWIEQINISTWAFWKWYICAIEWYA